MNSHIARVIAHTWCRVCRPLFSYVPRLTLNYPLGSGHPSDFPATLNKPTRPVIPLRLMRCPKCSLIQLDHTTPRDWLYGRGYQHRSGAYLRTRQELNEVVRSVNRWACPGPHDVVVDIGASDGTLLANYNLILGREHPTRIAWEPAPNLKNQLSHHAEIAFYGYFPPSQKAVPLTDKLGAPRARNMLGGPVSMAHTMEQLRGRCQVVTTINTLEQVAEPHPFIHGVAQLLSRDGVWVIQFPDVLSMTENNALHHVMHERLMYFSLSSLSLALAPHALVIQDVERSTLEGGSLRAFVQHRSQRRTLAQGQRVRAQLNKEQRAGLNSTRFPEAAPFYLLRHRMPRLRAHLLALIRRVRSQGGVIDLYGAPPNLNTFILHFHLTHGIRRVIDTNPERWGRYTVTIGGMQMPIVSVEEGRAHPAALWICVRWTERDAVIREEAEYLAQGGAILFPLPRIEIVYGATAPQWEVLPEPDPWAVASETSVCLESR
jgi:NDP-4-keto-2,6-dideoxyhexose 3-C-methyltransferase